MSSGDHGILLLAHQVLDKNFNVYPLATAHQLPVGSGETQSPGLTSPLGEEEGRHLGWAV